MAICRYKTVSRAADNLYITHSSLSTRLKTLERELGGQLFFRQKGSRVMELTPAGKQFYELSVQYESLVRQMQQVCRGMPSSLRVSSLNSVDTFLLPAVYERFLQKHPDIKLEIQNMERAAATISIQNGDTDLAFTSGKNVDESLRQRLAFVEPMVLICSGMQLQEPVCLEQLSPRQEVYVAWSPQFVLWHQQVFGREHAQISISIMSHLQKFMEREDVWAIVPVSVAIGVEKSCPVRRLKMEFTPPPREMSIISSGSAKDNAATLAFYECLREALAEYPEIEMLL